MEALGNLVIRKTAFSPKNDMKMTDFGVLLMKVRGSCGEPEAFY